MNTSVAWTAASYLLAGACGLLLALICLVLARITWLVILDWVQVWVESRRR